ncbi:MAG: hypothetical protein ACQEQE_05930 [Bacillota bacterium]
MKKKIFSIFLMIILVFTFTSCSKFDYKEAMKNAKDTLQNSEKVEASTEIKFNEGFSEKVLDLAKFAEPDMPEKELNNLTEGAKVISNIELYSYQKADLEDLKMYFDLDLSYKGNQFIKGNVFMNNEYIRLDVNDLLTQAVTFKFSAFDEIMAQQNPNSEIKIGDMIKEQIKSSQQNGKKLYPIITSQIEENVKEPEVKEGKLSYFDKEIDTNIVEYKVDYIKALEIAKNLLSNEEFIDVYAEIQMNQNEYLKQMGAPDNALITKQKVNEQLTEASEQIDKILNNENFKKAFKDYDVKVSYHFDDGLKAIKYDLDFVNYMVKYKSLGQEIEFEEYDIQKDYVVESMQGIMGVMGILNNTKAQELQNHELIKDLESIE